MRTGRLTPTLGACAHLSKRPGRGAAGVSIRTVEGQCLGGGADRPHRRW
jgi:hypothetical protein